jgi:hypothetical protein
MTISVVTPQRGRQRRPVAPENPIGPDSRDEGEYLDFKPAPRLEQVGDKRSKQMEHGKHRGG